MVVEVSYAEWTPDGLLRHVVYLGEREDKPAIEVRRDPPVPSQIEAPEIGGATFLAPKANRSIIEVASRGATEQST
jgi:bifunctional non-homologous end joining protein LigD